MAAVSALDAAKNSNLRTLCKMARAWKNKHGVAMGGLLIDTLAYNFLNSTSDYDDKSFLYYDFLSRDFSNTCLNCLNKITSLRPESGQRVKVKKNFQPKAKRAHKLCLEAIKAEKQQNVNAKWKKVYGRPFPAAKETVSEASNAARQWKDTEQFIEDQYPVDIRESLIIDCEVKQDGFRMHFLRTMLANQMLLLAKKKLRFKVKEISVYEPYTIYWESLEPRSGGSSTRLRSWTDCGG